MDVLFKGGGPAKNFYFFHFRVMGIGVTLGRVPNFWYQFWDLTPLPAPLGGSLPYMGAPPEMAVFGPKLGPKFEIYS